MGRVKSFYLEYEDYLDQEPEPEPEEYEMAAKEIIIEETGESVTIDQMFTEVYESGLNEKAKEFIDSLYDYFDHFEVLTPKQLSALKKFYKNCQFRKEGFQK